MIFESEVIKYLEQFSVKASKIAESSEKTPDFIIHQEEIVLIELKEKFDTEEKHQNKENVLNAGDIYTSSNSMGYLGYQVLYHMVLSSSKHRKQRQKVTSALFS